MRISLRFIVWSMVSVSALAVLGVLVVTFPQRFPDQMLAIETSVSRFLTEVTLPIKEARLALLPPDTSILMPVFGARVGSVADTWAAPRDGGGRTHEGQDIFAARGTPVFSGTEGYVRRIRSTEIGGNNILITGKGGRRYYYAHLDRFADGLIVGEWVTTDTVLGYVGNTGNAVTTPPHLHFGMYERRTALNPLPLLTDRE